MSVPMNSGRDLENAFKQIITAGWAMKSDGNVEAPCGYFAKIPIEPNELSDLLDAVFDGEHPGEEANIEPGYYVTKEDSAGNIWIWKYDSKFMMDSMYTAFEREYAEWCKPTYLLSCNNCGSTFEDIQEAHEHGFTDPNTKAWCGDKGFVTIEQQLG
jgi:hypothetical protein